MSETHQPNAQADDAAPEISAEQRQRMRFKKGLRKVRRKHRESQGEVKDLNIIPMMDMMTIILVFLLKSYSTSSVSMASSGDIAPPISTTRLAPKDTVAVTVTRCSPSSQKDGKCRAGSGTIMVNEKIVLTFDNDKIAADKKQGGDDGLLIPDLLAELQKQVEKAKYIAQYNPAAKFTGELSVVGDRGMPYRLLTEVLYTAGQAELDNYRFVVIKKEGGGDGGGAPAGGEGASGG